MKVISAEIFQIPRTSSHHRHQLLCVIRRFHARQCRPQYRDWHALRWAQGSAQKNFSLSERFKLQLPMDFQTRSRPTISIRPTTKVTSKTCAPLEK